MASYPGAKVHRVSRRKLGKGQHVHVPAATVTATAETTTVTLVFSVPVVVSGVIPLTIVGGSPLVSQTVVDSMTVTQVYTSTVATKAWSIAAGIPQVATFQGGGLAAASGTF